MILVMGVRSLSIAAVLKAVTVPKGGRFHVVHISQLLQRRFGMGGKLGILNMVDCLEWFPTVRPEMVVLEPKFILIVDVWMYENIMSILGYFKCLYFANFILCFNY